MKKFMVIYTGFCKGFRARLYGTMEEACRKRAHLVKSGFPCCVMKYVKTKRGESWIDVVNWPEASEYRIIK